MEHAYEPAVAMIAVDCATQLAQTQRELETLSYAISHDLRAPVRAIAGFSQALKEQAGDCLDATAQHHLERIEQSTQRLSAMVDGLLRLSRVTQASLQLSVVDLSLLCQSVLQELALQDPKHHPQIHIAPHIQASCDPNLLRSALRELLHNAWKFTSERSDAQIHVSAEMHEGTVTLCVRDNGIGFEMRYADRLFVPFQHLQTRNEWNGLGIGLSCVQRIIHRHAGKLWADAAPQQGATFYFTLPTLEQAA